MGNKIQINIVYAPSHSASNLIYENEFGEIWTGNSKMPGMHNVGMGWYSIPDPQPEDSIMVMEPFCVLDRDYNVDFVSKFKYIFTWAVKAFTDQSIINKVKEINHPSCHDLPSPHNIGENWLPWDKRSNEIVFIANNKTSVHNSELYSFRLKLADMLHERSSFKVSWYGEIPINKPYYSGKAHSKQDILSKVKYSVCTENSYDPTYTHNYFTEKMPEVWVAGAIPIYMGCYNIDSFKFPVHSYIDLRIYCRKDQENWRIDLDSLLQRIESLDTPRYENFKSDVVSNIRLPNGLYNIISYKRVYDKLITTFMKH